MGRSTFMCLEVLMQVEPSAKGPIGPPALGATSGLSVRQIKVDGRTAFQISTNGTCSCGLLAAGCEPEAEHWTFTEEATESLARLAEALAAKGRTFGFLAHWPGQERPRRNESASPESLARTLRMNAVMNNVFYEVRT